MKWKEINVLAEPHCVEAIAGIFHRLGSGGVVIEDPRTAPPVSGREIGTIQARYPELMGRDFLVIKAYFPEDNQINDDIEAGLREVESNFAVPCRMFMNEVQEEDWSETWKQYFHTFKVGERLIIKPSWEIYLAADEEVVIEIDPGMAFGTGIHASTRFCLLFLDEYLQSGESVIDAGCGSGILAIAAAKLGAARVYCTDIDPLAVKIAGENVALNKLEHIIQVVHGDITHELPVLQADIILANIIADVVADLIPGAASCLPSGGWFFASGITEGQWPQVQKKLLDFGFIIEKVLSEAEWIGAAARKR